MPFYKEHENGENSKSVQTALHYDFITILY